MVIAVFDTSGNGIEDTGPLKAVGFSPDVSRPVLSNYSLNIEPGLLKLTFSDVVNATTFDASAITIQSSKTAITNQVVSLTPVTITNSSNGYVITVTLGLQDLLNIRDNTMLATRLNNTYLTIQAYAIDDVFDVDVLAVTDGKAILPGEYIPDTNPPDLERFTLDLDEGTLIFKLSDLLLESSFNATFINVTNGTTETIAITGGVPTRLSDGSTISLKLLNDDLDAIVINSNLGSSVNDTFIEIATEYVSDLANNSAPAVDSTEAFEVVPDTTPPQISSFSLDMNGGMLSLTINEIIPADSFNASFISLQGVANATDQADSIFTLSEETVSLTTGYSRVIEVQLSVDDLNDLKAKPSIAISRESTFISISGPAFTDVVENSVENIAVGNGFPSASFSSDITPPSLLDFSLDMDEGMLFLTFNEDCRCRLFPV